MTPTKIDRLKLVGDVETKNSICTIMSGEITYLWVGIRWFDHMCGMGRLYQVDTWYSSVKRYLHDDLKPPFNVAAHNATSFSAALCGPLATIDDLVASPENRPDA